MQTSYLLANAVLYLVFAAWCSLAPDTTSAALGLGLRTPGGRSEYVTVYGGLEAGIAVFWLIAALRRDLRTAGVLLAVCFYGAIIAWRTATLVLIPGIGVTTYAFAAFEWLLGLWGLAVWRLANSRGSLNSAA